MVFITIESYKNAGVNVIKGNKDYFWVKMKDVENGLDIKSISDLLIKEMQGIFETKKLTKEQKIKYVRSKFEIVKKFGDKKSKYARNDIMEKIIKNCRGVKQSNDGLKRLDNENQRQNFRELLGFKENQIFETKEYSIIKQIKKVFIQQKMIDQFKIDKYFIDLYLPEHNLGIEIDKNGHTDRLKVKEKETEETIKNLGITLIRINPDKEGFDIVDEMSEIQDFVDESGLKIGQ